MKINKFLTIIAIISIIGVIANWIIYFEYKAGYTSFIEGWLLGNGEGLAVGAILILFIQHNYKKLVW